MRTFDRVNFNISNLNFAQKIAILNVLVFLVYRLSFLFRLESEFLNLFSLRFGLKLSQYESIRRHTIKLLQKWFVFFLSYILLLPNFGGPFVPPMVPRASLTTFDDFVLKLFLFFFPSALSIFHHHYPS